MDRGSQVWGSKSLDAQAVVIHASNNTFSCSVDGVEYEITIPNGIYETDKAHFASDLIDPINYGLQAIQAPIKALLGGVRIEELKNVLVFEHTDKANRHVIEQFKGTAKDYIWGDVEFSR